MDSRSKGDPDGGDIATVGIEGLKRLLARQDPNKLLLLLEGQSRVLEMIAEGVRLGSILDSLMCLIEQQVDGMLCSVLLLAPDRKHLRHGAAPHLPEEYNRLVDGLPIGASMGSCGTAAFTGRPVIVSDIETDPLWADHKQNVLPFGLLACWSTPILSKRGDVLGTFAMYFRQPMSPSPVHLDLIALATHLAQLAIEHDSLVGKLSKERDESVSVLAVGLHELRSPLTALRLEIEGLLSLIRANGSPPEAERLILKSRRQIDRLARLLGVLFDVSRLSSGQLSLQYEDGDLFEIVSEAAAHAQPEFAHRGCTLTVDGAGPIAGKWDRGRIEQVVTNLLINALKYGGGQPVSVFVDGDEQYGRVQVRDSGIGIAADQQEMIFQRFGRAVTERDYEGVGLGLWITRQIVDALGGTIGVQSEIGKGATFTIVLPRAATPTPTSTTSP
jgi:signal transduction histidine kinase